MIIIPTLGDKHMTTPTEKLAYIITSYFSFTEHTTNMYVGYSRSLKKRVLDMTGSGSIDTNQLASQVITDINALIVLSFDMNVYVDISSATVELNSDRTSYDITVRAGVRESTTGAEYYIPSTSTITNSAIVVTEG